MKKDPYRLVDWIWMGLIAILILSVAALAITSLLPDKHEVVIKPVPVEEIVEVDYVACFKGGDCVEFTRMIMYEDYRGRKMVGFNTIPARIPLDSIISITPK